MTPFVFLILDEQDGMSFFDFTNFQHPNIIFTFDKQTDGKLSVLDILINNSSSDCVFFYKKNLHWSFF